MFKMFDSGLCPIGIDVGSHAVRMLQFRTAGSGLTLQGACRIELDSLDPGTLGATRAMTAVRHGLSSGDFAGRRVVLSLPTDCVHAKSLRLPPMPDADLHQALQWEARDRFGFDIGDNGGQMVWFRAGEVRRGTEVKDELLLFAVEGGVLNEYIRGLTQLGLKVLAVDLAPCAAYRSLRRTGAGAVSAETSAILDMGHTGAQFFMIRDEELVFYKPIDIGGRTINQAVAARLGICESEALQMRGRLAADSSGDEDAEPLAQALRDAMRAPLEELARELDMCMRYYVVTFRGARPEMIAVTGRQADCPRLRETLATTLALQVEEPQPLCGVLELGDAARPDRSSEWAVAAGLSLYPVIARAPAEAVA